jgi:hypothetical protein
MRQQNFSHTTDNLSPRQIRQEVRQHKESEQAPAQDTIPGVLPPPCRELPLQCFELIAPDRVACTRGKVIVDCGFNIWPDLHQERLTFAK